MEEDSVPKLRPYDLIHRDMSPQQAALIRSYNWCMTDHGWLRMDKKKAEPPSPPKEIAARDFLGQCFDEDENCWEQCFEFDKDGSIDSRDTSFHKVQSAAGNVEVDLDKALSLVANVSKAAGAIFILADFSGWHRMSGFFITDRHFITCAHFVVTPIIEEVLKKCGSKMARVCTDRKPHENDKTVHLVFRDIDRDFAIFCLDKDQQPQSPHLDLDRDFPGVDQLDFKTELANRRAFAIGYNTRHEAEDFPQTHQKVIQSLKPGNKEVQVQAARARAPEFEDIFLPNRKTLSIGRLDSDSPSKNAVMWKHRISGWHGISGALIACLDLSSTAEAKVQVLGLCKSPDEMPTFTPSSESTNVLDLVSGGAKGNYNEMLPLTSEIIRVIRDTIRSHPAPN